MEISSVSLGSSITGNGHGDSWLKLNFWHTDISDYPLHPQDTHRLSSFATESMQSKNYYFLLVHLPVQ